MDWLQSRGRANQDMRRGRNYLVSPGQARPDGGARLGLCAPGELLCLRPMDYN